MIKTGCVALVEGDFKDVFAEFSDSSVGAILTDPPYGRSFLHLYRPLFQAAGRVLKPGGDFVTIIPQYTIPDIAAWLCDTELEWRWSIVMDQSEGPHPRLCNQQHNIEVLHKLMGWMYKKGGPPDYRNVKDLYVNDPKGNDHGNEWTQSDSWAQYLVGTFGVGRDLVVDPMVGTGTILVECLLRGISAIGIDNDPEQIKRAADRLAAVYEAVGDVTPDADL